MRVVEKGIKEECLWGVRSNDNIEWAGSNS